MNIALYLYGSQYDSYFYQGTIGCTPNSVPMVFIVFNLGILGDEKTHKYPLYIGLIDRDFPFGVRWARGTSKYPFNPLCSVVILEWVLLRGWPPNTVGRYSIIRRYRCFLILLDR